MSDTSVTVSIIKTNRGLANFPDIAATEEWLKKPDFNDVRWFSTSMESQIVSTSGLIATSPSSCDDDDNDDRPTSCPFCGHNEVDRASEVGVALPDVGKLVAELRMMASQAAEACQFTDAESLSRAADLLEQQATAYAICERERLHQSTRATDLLMTSPSATSINAKAVANPSSADP